MINDIISTPLFERTLEDEFWFIRINRVYVGIINY